MKKNELSEIKKIEMTALKERITKAKNEIAGLVIDKNMGKLTNLKEVKNKRRDLAQMLTVQKQRQLLEALEDQNGK